MKRRNFLRNSAIAAGSALIAGNTNAKNSSIPAQDKDFYELKVYQLTSRGSVNQLSKYYKEAVVPFLNSRNGKVGAYQEYGMEEPPKVYVLQAFKTPEDYFNATIEMRSNKEFLDAAEWFYNIPADRPVYERYETFLATAFDSITRLKMPDNNAGLYELRTYESYNEEAGQRKVKMFNDEELPLFEKVGLHPVFFGQLIAGGLMPALVYMLWFKDMEQREANWQKFGSSDEWNVMKNKEIYADTVSKVRKKFLTPLEFSQI